MSSTQEVSEQLARRHFTAACSGFHLLHAYMSGLISLCVAAGAQDERFLPRMKASSRIVSLSFQVLGLITTVCTSSFDRSVFE